MDAHDSPSSGEAIAGERGGYRGRRGPGAAATEAAFWIWKVAATLPASRERRSPR